MALALATRSGSSASRLTNRYSSGMKALVLRSVLTPRPHRRFTPGLRTTAASLTATAALCCESPERYQAATCLQTGSPCAAANIRTPDDPRRSQPRAWSLVLHPDDEPITLSASVTRIYVIRLKCSAPEHSWRGLRKLSEILRQPASFTRVESRRTTLPHNRLQLFTRINLTATSCTA
jgi:hypothetical protein